MRTALSIFSLLWIGFFALVGAQLPELVVQYAQRTGGAADEAGAYLQKFDEGTSRAGYSREAAIAALLKNRDRLVYEQGVVAQIQLERFLRLTRQKAALGSGITLGGIYHFVTDYDAALLRQTLSNFVPGFSLSPAGLFFTLIGGLIGAASLLFMTRIIRASAKMIEA